eukprot:CAMPEP_0202796988 /NCGR_PEP_ID=MMETSP1388-20130828/93256_1 /ASSEMBLY_ACC=CAM_ASM_000864 /TAXON_ID=37098 /ORGANISM="Isochrysis sp, Strain CCMP1244" /LENGTH=215 /DNA_ID=CAMNT_0049466893 /DNA_START=259 /DNA_END=903 /DNA_ORIENTATION=+
MTFDDVRDRLGVLTPKVHATPQQLARGDGARSHLLEERPLPHVRRGVRVAAEQLVEHVVVRHEHQRLVRRVADLRDQLRDPRLKVALRLRLVGPPARLRLDRVELARLDLLEARLVAQALLRGGQLAELLDAAVPHGVARDGPDGHVWVGEAAALPGVGLDLDHARRLEQGQQRQLRRLDRARERGRPQRVGALQQGQEGRALLLVGGGAAVAVG